MLKHLSRALTALAFLFAPAVHAQDAVQDADPALWVVKDEDTTIYLFGTVHVLKPGLSWFDEAVKAAFDKSDEVVLEMIQPDQATMGSLVMKTALNIGGPTITEQLPADKRAAYAKALTDSGIAPSDLDPFHPWYAAVALSVLPLRKLGYDPESGAEAMITASAKAAGKQLVGLETAEQQIGYFAALPDTLQVKFLVSTVDDYPKLGDELGKMITSWAAGDPETLGKTMNEGLRETPEIGKILLTDRNARWADWIDKRLAKPGTVFVAIGAGHLAGDDSVQAFLAKRNLKATRIPY
ncbi:TraB/GumN family protein [Sphingomonas sp. JC676]|uniref:TraB/GumN family protein n=1 Tax=Sphingomonas sp. JC676 TaxID=2768065 RepID=UPI0016581D6B|nr:TraB/GumN family protein [Sphingomonas sp. JC676]MBC9034042.1 TraB/GumN family protein [Sphingomonas sp. JC676]